MFKVVADGLYFTIEFEGSDLYEAWDAFKATVSKYHTTILFYNDTVILQA